MEVAHVVYQSQRVGAVSFDSNTGLGAFEYTGEFLDSGIELSPIMMPLSNRIYTFPELSHHTFKGLPGMLADSLPDDFGNSVLNAWVSAAGKQVTDITPLQRLQYTGKRGMGAVEYAPAKQLKSLNASARVQINSLLEVTQEILNQREQFALDINDKGKEDRDAMLSLLSVGMSAGGARPKAVLAFNEDFSKVRSGQAPAPKGFTHCIMKFDGISEHNQNRETFGDPQGFGAMEYVYSLLAKAAGVEMMPCRLLNEGNRRHFITERFDRANNNKIHIQTLNAITHVDYKNPASYSYAELFSLARTLKLKSSDAEQLFRRMLFNIVARNHDDHSKNISFMLKDGHWQLTPAYDLAYSYKPGSKWVNSHWMTLNGKRDDFSMNDFYTFEKISPLFKRSNIKKWMQQTTDAVSQWRKLATENDVPRSLIDEIDDNIRLLLR